MRCQRATSPCRIRTRIAKAIQTVWNVIEFSFGHWTLPVVLVKKKDGLILFCVDYQGSNTIVKRDVFIELRMNDALDVLEGQQYFLHNS